MDIDYECFDRRDGVDGEDDVCDCSCGLTKITKLSSSQRKDRWRIEELEAGGLECGVRTIIMTDLDHLDRAVHNSEFEHQDSTWSPFERGGPFQRSPDVDRDHIDRAWGEKISVAKSGACSLARA